MNLRALEDQYGLPPGLLTAIYNAEGSGPTAVSPKGATGSFQFMPATAQAYGLTDPTDPEASAVAAAKYMADAEQRYNSADPRVLMAEYNGGPTQAKAVLAGQQPPAKETQVYIAKAPKVDLDALINALPPAQGQQGNNLDAMIAALPDVRQKANPQQASPRQAMIANSIASASPFGFTPDLVMGARQVVDAGAQMLTRGIAAGANAIAPGSDIANWLSGQRQNVENVNQKAIDAYRSEFRPDLRPGSGIARGVGQALVTAPIAAIGGPAAGAIKAATQGALTGAATNVLTPVYDTANFGSEKLGQAGSGALIGGLTGGAGNIIGRVLSPNVSPEMKLLLNEGVTPPPGAVYGDNGTLLGNVVKYGEQKMAGTAPILGDAINMGQARSIRDFNTAIYNRVLAPLGKVFKGTPGQEALGNLKTTVGQAYDDALAQAVPTVPDQAFTGAIAKIASMVPQSARADFVNTIKSHIADNLTPAGTIAPSVARDADSALGQLVRDYSGSTGSDAVLGRAYMQAQAELRQLFARANPTVAPQIAAANKAYAQLVQLQEAAKTVKVARADGLLTPADYLRGIKAADHSLRDTRFSSGQMLNQDLAQAADKILSNTTANSGTTGRAATLAAATGLIHPATAPIAGGTLAGAALASIPYLPYVQHGAAALMAMRPAAMGAVGDLIKRAAPYLAAAAPAGLLNPPQ